MPFKLELNENIKEDAKILIPLSIGKKECTGERLKALVTFSKNRNVTFLLADSLQQYNLESEAEALKLGDKFLENNQQTFKDAVIIDTLDKWNKYRDLPEMKVMRWNMWKEIKKDQLKEVDELIEKSESVYNAMKKVAKSNATAKDEQSSIAYQKEENKYMLTYLDFDYHLYSGLNESQLKVYELFGKSHKLPKHLSPRFVQTQLDNITFLNQKKRHASSLPFALRLIIKQIVEALDTPELSSEAKIVFLQQLKELTFTIIPEEAYSNSNSEKENGSPIIPSYN